MDVKTFNQVLEAQLERSTSTLLNKAAEYAGDNDRLHNFRQAAYLGKTNLREALGGMMIKHTVSIYDMINSGDQYPEEMWNEKITDHINYLLLLRAVIEDDNAIYAGAPTKAQADEALSALKDRLMNGPTPTQPTPPSVVPSSSPSSIPNA